MTASVVEAPATTPRRPSRATIAEAALLVVLAAGALVVLYQQAERQSFSVDESRWIATSRYFWITFVDRDLFGPAWQPNYLVLTHPPVARYLIGAGLALQGWSPDELNGRYDTDRSRDFNRRAGNIPSRELLNDARNVVLFFALGATLLLYPIGRSVGGALGRAGPLAGAAAVALALAHPLLATVWTRALAESILAFFSLLAIWLAIRLAARSGRSRSRFGLAIGLGCSVGLATATKLSGSLVAAGLVLYVAARQALRLWHDRSLAGLGPWIDAGLAAVLIFVAVNPLLYPNPAWRSALLFEHRREEMEQQAIGTPRLAIPNDLAVRATMLYRRTFEDWGTFAMRSGLPLDAPLAAAGLGVVAFATWRSIRRREAFGPPALLLCWTAAVYLVSTVNFGFDSSHYVAPPAMVAVLLQAVALAALATAGAWLVRRRLAACRARPRRSLHGGVSHLVAGSRLGSITPGWHYHGVRPGGLTVQVPYSFLDRQFEDPEPYLDEMREIIAQGNFTLGAPVEQFERQFAAYCGVPHAVGLASGTDALMLALQAVGVGHGDEVITVSATFIATVGAIASVGARPVFVDVDDGIVMDPAKVEAAITPRSQGDPARPLDRQHGRHAQPSGRSRTATTCRSSRTPATPSGRGWTAQAAGNVGDVACFSFHPVKHINAWGDGGILVTRSDELAAGVRIARNYGLVDRDEAETFARNSRLHTLQIPVLRRQLEAFEEVVARRNEIARRYDAAFADLGGRVRIPRRRAEVRHSFVIYVIMTEQRDAMIAHLRSRGVDARIHYPIPMHLTRAGRKLGHQEGDFPVTEAYARETITLPAHQYLTDEQVAHTIDAVRSYFE